MAERESFQNGNAGGPPSRKAHWRSTAVWCMGLAAACLLAYLLGPRFLLRLVGPAVVGGAAAFLLARRLAKPSTKPMLPAIAVQAGQMAALAVVVAGGSVRAIAAADYPPSILLSLRIQAVELSVLVVGLTWLLLRPGPSPVLLLILYQWATYTLRTIEHGGRLFITHPPNIQAWSAYLFHVLLGGLAVWLMVSGLRSIRTAGARPVLTVGAWCAIIGLGGMALFLAPWSDLGLWLLGFAYSPHVAMILGPFPAAFATIFLGRWLRDQGMHAVDAVVLAIVAWPLLTLVLWFAGIVVLTLRYGPR